MADNADSKDWVRQSLTDVSFQVYEAPRIESMTPEQLRERIFQLWQAAETGYGYICNFPVGYHGATEESIAKQSKAVGDTLYGRGPATEAFKVREPGVEVEVYTFNPPPPGKQPRPHRSVDISKYVTRLEVDGVMQELQSVDPEDTSDGAK